MKRPLIVLLAFVAAIAALAPAASAKVPIEAFAMVPSGSQAGGHPDLQIGFSLDNGKKQQVDPGINTPCDCENARLLTVHAPAGLVGNPHATPQCTAAEFASVTCPIDSQIGVVQVGISSNPRATLPLVSPVFNLAPRTGEAGLLAFQILGAPIYEIISSRTGSDYGLDTAISVTNNAPLAYNDEVLWGVPADPSHDELRFELGATGTLGRELCDGDGLPSSPGTNDPGALPSGPGSVFELCPGAGLGAEPGYSSNSPLTPFIEAPTTCGIPLEASFDVLSYDGETTHASSPYLSTTGCDQLSFNPSLAAKPTTTESDSPSGIDIDLTVPQFQSPAAPSPSSIRGTTVSLPEGFTINANAADGKVACTDAEARFGTLEEAQCPENAKIGTLSIDSAILPGELPGYVYLGQPLPGERYRVFLVADGFNVHVKLPGTLHPDPRTGRLSISFDELPQTPFERFTLHIFGSERGSLATPTKCGTYEVSTAFMPWDSGLGEQTSKQSFTVDSGPGGSSCPGASRSFAPSFQAGSVSNAAGSHSPFSVEISRPDGDQNLTGLTIKTPPGFSATIKGIPYCPEAAIAQLSLAGYSGLAEQASSVCPAASEIGTAVAGAGAGSKPLYADGKVYLAGPYKGAPLSLVVVIPAVSGPYDLGNVAVRAAIDINQSTAQITTISDPLPEILEGIPLRTRSIRVDLNRPGFTLNPTNCSPASVLATINGDEGAASNPSAPYQVANCAAMGFTPMLALNLTGGTKRTGHPAVKAVLKTSPGDANVAQTAVTMPHSLFLDNDHINAPCTRVQFAADACPSSSVIGSASATTPLLSQPMQGPVYLRSSSHRLPDIVADLRGQIGEIVLDGRIDSVHERLRTRFESVPDVPVTSFVLKLDGGRKGLLINSANLCLARQKALVRFVGQNGKRSGGNQTIKTPCGKKPRLKRRGRHSSAGARSAGRDGKR